MEQWVYGVGLALGSVAILSACWVWIKKTTFGTGGGALVLGGVILVGLSIWRQVKVEITPDGLNANFDRLEKQIDQVRTASAMVAQQVTDVTNNVEAQKQEFTSLIGTIQRTTPAATPDLSGIRMRMQQTPVVNSTRSADATRILRSVPRDLKVEPFTR